LATLAEEETVKKKTKRSHSKFSFWPDAQETTREQKATSVGGREGGKDQEAAKVQKKAGSRGLPKRHHPIRSPD